MKIVFLYIPVIAIIDQYQYAPFTYIHTYIHKEYLYSAHYPIMHCGR